MKKTLSVLSTMLVTLAACDVPPQAGDEEEAASYEIRKGELPKTDRKEQVRALLKSIETIPARNQWKNDNGKF